MREAAKRDCNAAIRSLGGSYFEELLVKNADRVSDFDEGLRAEVRVAAEANPKAQWSHTTLEALT